MKSLNEILSESLLDADFDIGVEDIYADNIISKVIEIMSVRKFKDYDKIVKELHDLLKSAARSRQEQDASSIQRRFRSNDNISIYMEKEGAGFTSTSIQKLIKRPQPTSIQLWLYKQEDGSCRTLPYLIHQASHLNKVTQNMKETLVFLKPELWDDVMDAFKNT